MQLASGKKRLQQVSGVHGTLGFSRADDIVNFIDKEDNLALGLSDVIENRLQSFFKLSSIFCTGNERAHIERKNFLILQRFGYIALRNSLCEPFHGSRLSNTGFSD